MTAARTRRLHAERRMVQAANFRARPYWLGTVGWILYFASPILPGWLVGEVFDEFEHRGATTRAVVLIVALGIGLGFGDPGFDRAGRLGDGEHLAHQPLASDLRRCDGVLR